MDTEKAIAQLAAAIAAQQLVLEHLAREVPQHTHAMSAALAESRTMLTFVRTQLGPAPTELVS